MMSSEEEPDCFGPYGDKLSKKAKRSRQRVDAGEPRNSYSSIPNFSSRPSFLSGSLYGAFLSQGQHLGLLGQGFPPAKMLNELLGRQVKQAADATTPTEAMITMEAAGSVDVNYECLNSTPVIRRGLEDDSSPPPGDVAHHMLRDILQGRKKEFLALEQELRASSNPAPLSPDNNNSINNNNNEVKPNIINGSEVNHAETNGDVKPVVNGVSDDPASGGEDPNADEILSDDGKPREDENNLTHASDSEQSIVSPADSLKLIKEEPEEAKDKTEQLELKRARVENIVSSMRSSPSLPTQVNGCKKRKLYHPQQHDTSDRYSSIGLAMNMGMFIDDESGDNSIDNSEIRQKKVEKDALKNQLRTMQEQLAEMKQKYAQLCTRMDQDSECPNEEDGSDIDQDNNSLSLPEKPMKRSPTTTPVKEIPQVTTQVSTPTHATVTPAISKMMTPKLQPPINTQQLPMPPNFNGALSLLQQQVLQEHPISHHHSHHHHHPQMTHHALSNAAAMYLGVSHKLFMEQEARLNKEAALAAEQHQQQLNQQQQQHQQQQQQQQQQPSLHHHHPQLHPPPTAPQSQQHSVPATSQHSQTPTQNAQSNRQSPPQHHQPPPPKPDYSDRLLRPPGPTPDLEGLADVLKTEITSSLGTLIDQIMSRFVQQKRLIGKPEAAAELNKDLMLASQLLDRKSPRTKVIDRGSNGSERPGIPTVNGPSTTPTAPPRINGTVFSVSVPHQSTPDNNISTLNLPVRPSPNTSMFQPPKPPTSINSALYSGMGAIGAHANPFCMDTREGAPEQNEALSLVVAPKKKRHKVTDTRITPRTVSRILAQDGMGSQGLEPNKFGPVVPSTSNSSESPPPRSYHAPPPILPVSLPTSVAIPNPSLHESQVFSPYSPFYHQSHPQLTAGSPPEMRDSPPLPHPPSLLHPALLAAAQHGTSPDYAGMRVSSALNSANDNVDRTSDCNSGDGPYDGITPTISFK